MDSRRSSDEAVVKLIYMTERLEVQEEIKKVLPVFQTSTSPQSGQHCAYFPPLPAEAEGEACHLAAFHSLHDCCLACLKSLYLSSAINLPYKDVAAL